jgi:hypothetical protein
VARQKKEPRKKAPATLPLRVAKHIEALGFGSVSVYLEWCTAHAFQPSTEKTLSQLEDEKRAYERQVARRDASHRASRNPRRIIEKACEGELRAGEIAHHRLRQVCERIEASDRSEGARRSLRDLLLKVHEEGDFLAESVIFGDTTFLYIDGLVALNSRRDQWTRRLDSWTSRSHNSRRQFSSLARHLLAKYPVPLFMDSVWFRHDPASHDMRDWFILMGSGKNIRKAKIPIPLTKMMAHYLLEAPSHYSVENAIRWGQVHAFGGDSRLVESLLGTRLGNSFEQDEFWVTVVRFFIENPMMDRAHVGPIVDYLQHQKYEPQAVFVAPGVREHQPPPQPNLSMKGRAPGSLLRQVERWHRQLGRHIRAGNLRWDRSSIGEFEFETGIRGKNLKVWRLRELLSSGELIAEGRAMRHCVATYAGSCAAGQCSIWTMELHGFDGVERRQTIEVNRNRVIVQSRGKYNAVPNDQELQILKRWAEEQGLQVSRYIATRI